MFRKRLVKNLDYVLVGSILFILTYGLLIVGTARTSATWVKEQLAHRGIEANVLEYLWEASLWERIMLINFQLAERQALWMLIGLALMLLIMYIPYEEYKRFGRKIYILNLIILSSVLFMGYEAMGAQRWIQLGPFAFQPSEFAKVLVIISLAGFLASREGKLHRLRDLLPVFAYVAIPVFLILRQPDLGTSLVLFAIMFGMLYAAGARPALLGGILGTGIFAVVGWIWAHLKFGLWIPLHEYQLSRLIIFIDPWADFQGAGYHIIQSQIAIGSSGLTGKGVLRGTQSLGEFLPIPESDFIFSVLAEQLGFIGAALLLVLYAVMLYKLVMVAMDAKDSFGMLLVVGVVSMFSFHILINVGMVMGIMPVTGLPLPLFSHGGSSMIANLAALGLALNVQIRRKKILF